MMKDKYKTLITACWIVLGVCFLIKLLGGNFFEIKCNNENFIKFCNYVSNNKFIYYTIAYITSLSSILFIEMAMLNIKQPKKIMVLLITLVFCIKLINELTINNIIINTILDLLNLIGIPLIINYKKWKRIILGCILVFILQFVSLITKNIGIKNIQDNIITLFIFMIDYYIMILLYYFYSIRKE